MRDLNATMIDDRKKIAALVADQVDCVNRDQDRPIDSLGFEVGFVTGAQVFDSKRPARRQSASDFTARLERLLSGGMTSFATKGIGFEVFIVGNIAIAMEGREIIENETATTRGVSAFLLVKNPDEWKIAGQAWDYVDDINKAFAAAGLHRDPGAAR